MSSATDRPARPVPDPPGLATVAVLRPVRTGNAFEDALERLLDAVKLGVFRTGERLPAGRDLAARLGVSRATLRGALRVLEQAGYVELRRGRFGGTFITEGSAAHRPAVHGGRDRRSELDDVLVHREAVEVGAAVAAARAPLSDGQRSHLRRCADEVAHASPADYRKSDSRLHLAIAELTGSGSLVAAVADARIRICDLLDAIPLIEPNLAHSTRQHGAVVAAILAGDERLAGARMAEHVAGTAALLRGFLS